LWVVVFGIGVSPNGVSASALGGNTQSIGNSPEIFDTQRNRVRSGCPKSNADKGLLLLSKKWLEIPFDKEELGDRIDRKGKEIGPDAETIKTRLTKATRAVATASSLHGAGIGAT
jgi:hypothetical protein